MEKIIKSKSNHFYCHITTAQVPWWVKFFTAGQDALHSAGVEGSEDSGARSKLPQPSQEEETLMCLLQHCICVSRPCEILGDVNAEELKAGSPAPQVSCRWWWVCVLCSVSCNPPPAPWSCRCWVRGGSPDTILSGYSPPLCRPSHQLSVITNLGAKGQESYQLTF